MLKKKITSIVAIAASLMLATGAVTLNVKANADNELSNAFTGGVSNSGNLFEAATISDANYIINQWDGNGDSLVTVGDYIATKANGSHVTVGGILQMPITTSDASKALSYSGAKLTLEETTTLEMGVVDLTDSRAEDVSPVIGFVPSLNFLGPQTAEEITNPYLGIYYTFRSTVNPEKYFSVAMKESNTYKYASLGIGYNGTSTHYGQGLPNDPGVYWNIDDSDRTGYSAFRFDGSMITNTSGQCTSATKRVWIADNVAADGGEAEYNYNYPIKIYYDYETSCFYQQAVEYTRRDKFGEKGMRVTADDGSHRYLLFNAAQGSVGKGYSTANKNTNGWEGFTEEEAKSVAVTMHVDWNPEYTGSHDILITDFAGQQVSTANADTLKANKGTSGLLKEFTGEDGILSLSDGYSVMLSDNDVFTKLVSFEVYPEQMGRSKNVNNSGLYSVSFRLSDGTDTLQMNLTNFAEVDENEVVVDYRNCYTVSVNGEDKWAQNQKMEFVTGEFGFPSPYGFDKYVRYPASILLDQYGVDDDPGVDETKQWYSSDVIRTDVNATPMASYSIYYNAADNCLYADAGSWFAERYSNHTRADGVTVKRWKIADLSSTYDGQREAFAGFGDKLLSFSMSTTLVDGFDSAKIRILEVDGQKLGTDSNGQVSISENTSSKVFTPSNTLILAGEDITIPAPFKHNVLSGKLLLDSNEYTVKITDPNGTVYENIEDNKFDFTLIGDYSVEYFVGENSIGKTTFTTATTVDGELVAFTAFNIKENVMDGDTLTFADLSITTDSTTLSLEGATIIISKDGTAISTDENITSAWTSPVLANGVYEIVVKNDAFVISKEMEVRTCIVASALVENGVVKVNDVNNRAMLLEGSNTIQIIANEGYQIDTFVIDGVDVTSEIVNGYYIYNAENVTKNVYYVATFKKLTYIVTFMAGETVLATESGVEYGTLLKNVTMPNIPEKAGYEINGWSEDGETEIKENLTVYAVYSLKTYTITFDVDGGTAMAAKEYSAEEVVTAFEETTSKEGYIFDGWYLGDTKFVFGNVLTGDITLKAKWIAEPIDDPNSSDSTDSSNSSTSSEDSNTSAPSTSSEGTSSSDSINIDDGGDIGCGSSISCAAAVMSFVVLAAGVCIKRKKD